MLGVEDTLFQAKPQPFDFSEIDQIILNQQEKIQQARLMSKPEGNYLQYAIYVFIYSLYVEEWLLINPDKYVDRGFRQAFSFRDLQRIKSWFEKEGQNSLTRFFYEFPLIRMQLDSEYREDIMIETSKLSREK